MQKILYLKLLVGEPIRSLGVNVFVCERQKMADTGSDKEQECEKGKGSKGEGAITKNEHEYLCIPPEENGIKYSLSPNSDKFVQVYIHRRIFFSSQACLLPWKSTVGFYMILNLVLVCFSCETFR